MTTRDYHYTRDGHGLVRAIGNLARLGGIRPDEFLGEAIQHWRTYLRTNDESDRRKIVEAAARDLRGAGARLAALGDGDVLNPVAREWELYLRHHPVTDRTARDLELEAKVRPLPRAAFECDYAWHFLQETIDKYASSWGGCNLDPDFQRGHVWSREQKVAFVENACRGVAPNLTLVWNHPHWDMVRATDLPLEMQLVDGRQRLSAVLDFMADKLEIFDGETARSLRGTRFDPARTQFRFRFAIYQITARRELLQFYLDLNTGGSVHSPAEIERVRGLMRAAAAPPGGGRLPGPKR